MAEPDAESGIELSAGPVYSVMAQQNPKFEAIAKQFVERLIQKTKEMQACLDQADFSSLADHAHWLKGSGGTVGFIEFIEPAKALEVAAKQENAEHSNQKLAVIKDIQSRISFDYDSDLGNTTGAKNVSQFTETNHAAHEGVPLIEPPNIDADKNNASGVEPVTSALPMNNPRFRGIVERYLPRLDDQIESIQVAINAEDYIELAKLAHWLKGSGGNVGYDGFTQLAASLESSAKASNKDQIAENLEAILSYCEQVKLGWELLDPLEKTA